MYWLQAVLLGLGLAMDAAAVSMADGLKEEQMPVGKILLIAGLFGLFQGVMPLVGYAAGSLLAEYIAVVAPYLALAILAFLGIKMIVEAVKRKEDDDPKPLTLRVLLLQAVATSIDALTVGLVYVGDPLWQASLVFGIIAFVTFGISVAAVCIGRKFHTLFARRAEIFGGVILISIGLKIFIEYLISVL